MSTQISRFLSPLVIRSAVFGRRCFLSVKCGQLSLAVQNWGTTQYIEYLEYASSAPGFMKKYDPASPPLPPINHAPRCCLETGLIPVIMHTSPSPGCSSGGLAVGTRLQHADGAGPGRIPTSRRVSVR